MELDRASAGEDGPASEAEQGPCEDCGASDAERGACEACGMPYCEYCAVGCDWREHHRQPTDPCPNCNGCLRVGDQEVCAWCFWSGLHDAEIEFCYTHGRFVADLSEHSMCQREATLQTLKGIARTLFPFVARLD